MEKRESGWIERDRQEISIDTAERAICKMPIRIQVGTSVLAKFSSAALSWLRWMQLSEEIPMKLSKLFECG